MINVDETEIVVRGWNLVSLVCLRSCRQVSPWLSYIFDFVGLVKNETLQSLNPKDRELGIPSMREPASTEITATSVEQCETEVCFLRIQLVGTKARLPKMHESHPMLISHLLSHRQNQNLGIIPIYIVVLSFPHGSKKNKRAERLSDALVHFVMVRACLFTDHRISNLPTRAKYRHFRTILRAYL